MTTTLNAAKIILAGDTAQMGTDGVVRVKQRYTVEMLSKAYSAADALFADAGSAGTTFMVAPGPAAGFSAQTSFPKTLQILALPDPGASSSTVAASLFNTYGITISELSATRQEKDSLIFDVSLEGVAAAPQYGGALHYDPTPGGSANTIFVWDAKVTTTSQQAQEPIYKDNCPTTVTPPYRSSSGPQTCLILTGEPLNPPLMQDFYDEMITITFRRNTDAPRNVAATPSTYINYFDVLQAAKGTTNNATVNLTIGDSQRSFSTNTLKVYDAQLQYDNLTFMLSVQIVILARTSTTWKTKVQSQSTQILGTAGDYTTIGTGYDGRGQLVTSPMMHNSSGTAFIANYGALPAPMEFYPSPQADWTELLFGVSPI